MSWEADYEEGIVVPNQKRVVTCNWLIFITFAGPAIISLVYSFLLIIFTILSENKLLPSDWLPHIKPIYPGISAWLAASCFIINIFFFLAYMPMFLISHQGRLHDKNEIAAQLFVSGVSI